jgi:hypothetical protein
MPNMANKPRRMRAQVKSSPVDVLYAPPQDVGSPAAATSSALGDSNLTIPERQSLVHLMQGKQPEPGMLSNQTLARRLRHKTPLREAFLRLCEHAGLTDDAIARVLHEAMGARVVVTNARRGTAVESDAPDHSIRFKAATEVARIKGYYPKENDRNPTVVNIHTNLFSESAGVAAIRNPMAITDVTPLDDDEAEGE